MQNKINNLKDLLIEEGRELYNSTQQELNELPKMERQVNSPKLKEIIRDQIETCERQRENLRDVFNKIDATLEEGTCETTHAILKRSQELYENSDIEEVRDAAIINSLQRLSHRKIAGYGTSAAYAKQIGHKDVAKSLHKAVEDEKRIDSQLTKLSEKEINHKAAAIMT